MSRIGRTYRTGPGTVRARVVAGMALSHRLVSMYPMRIGLFRLALIVGPLWFGYACSTKVEVPTGGMVISERPKMTPPIMLTDINPWRRAEMIAAEVPHSSLLVVHGDTFFPVYPGGTILVIQRLSLENLRPGMTVGFSRDWGNPLALSVHVLDAQLPEGDWMTGRLGVDVRINRIRLDDKTYAGTVVAAVRRPEGADDPMADPELLRMTSQLYCSMQCHVGGEVHPKNYPAAQVGVWTEPEPKKPVETPAAATEILLE